MTWRPEWEEQPRRGFGFGRGVHGWGAARTLVVTCILVTLASMIYWSQQSPPPGEPRRSLATWLGLSTSNALWIYPWFTYVFVHDVESVAHILFNGVLLWFLGIELEERLGRGRFLTLFFGAALVGAAAHIVVQAAAGIRAGPMIGASGGIFGLLFYIARETPNRPFVFWLIPIPAKVLAGLYVVLETYPLLINGFSGDGIAHLCHLGGAAFGLLYFKRPFDALAGWSSAVEASKARAETRRREHGVRDDAEMDRLLRKIHESGMASLDEQERAFLDERSRRMRGGGA